MDARTPQSHQSHPAPQPHHDAFSPREIAHRVKNTGVAKAKTDTLTMLVLSVLAGAFISLGALFFIVATTGSTLGFGITRLVGGLAFSLGLILVVVGGAELFTGNNLIAMAWASHLVTTRQVLRNWAIVYLGNVIGAIATVVLVTWSDVATLSAGAVGELAVRIAVTKTGLTLTQELTRGILCNALVCLGVWLAMGGRSTMDKILAIIFPVTAFVALGFEHSIANWFFLPYGVLLAAPGTIASAAVWQNLAVVTAGNIIGGTLMVAGVYYMAYLRGEGLMDRFGRLRTREEARLAGPPAPMRTTGESPIPRAPAEPPITTP
jgi:formate/nitrite transporter